MCIPLLPGERDQKANQAIRHRSNKYKAVAADISIVVQDGLQPSNMRCTKAAACLWSLCCLTSAESRFGRLGCDDLSGRKFFQVTYGISALLREGPTYAVSQEFHRRYIDSQVLKKISAPEHEGADEYS
jgi:hypothetical protein